MELADRAASIRKSAPLLPSELSEVETSATCSQTQRSQCTLSGREMTLITIEDFVLLSPTTFGVIQFDISQPRAEYFSCFLNVFTLVQNTTSRDDDGAGVKESLYEPIKIAVFELPRWLAVIMIRECVAVTIITIAGQCPCHTSQT